MRHRSRRPLFDTLARPRLAVGLAALCVGGAGAALVVSTSADEHTADAPRARETARTSGSTEPVDLPTRTKSPSRGGPRHATPTAPPSAPAPTTATETPEERPTPPEDASVRVRATVRDTTPTPRVPSPPTPSRTPSATPPDTTAPDTSIQTVATTGPGAVFRLGSDGAATYRCSVDGGAFTLCAPAVTLTDLTPGWHTLAAQAVDPAGNADPTPAQTRWHANGALP